MCKYSSEEKLREEFIEVASSTDPRPSHIKKNFSPTFHHHIDWKTCIRLQFNQNASLIGSEGDVEEKNISTVFLLFFFQFISVFIFVQEPNMKKEGGFSQDCVLNTNI